jgi:hypothetical protein
MTLLQQQFQFSSLVALLLQKVEDFGLQVTLGAAWREGDPRCHGMRLAIDINLFRDGVYLTGADGYTQLGEWWENLDPLCRWGGRFEDARHPGGPDFNHYSMTYGGMA